MEPDQIMLIGALEMGDQNIFLSSSVGHPGLFSVGFYPGF
jgi:hypothetical protein